MTNERHNSLIIRGHERIRTAVAGFADQSLTTRPRDHFFGNAKL